MEGAQGDQETWENQKIQLEINTCLENIKHDLIKKSLQCPQRPNINGINCGTKQEPGNHFVFYKDWTIHFFSNT